MTGRGLLHCCYQVPHHGPTTRGRLAVCSALNSHYTYSTTQYFYWLHLLYCCTVVDLLYIVESSEVGHPSLGTQSDSQGELLPDHTREYK